MSSPSERPSVEEEIKCLEWWDKTYSHLPGNLLIRIRKTATLLRSQDAELQELRREFRLQTRLREIAEAEVQRLERELEDAKRMIIAACLQYGGELVITQAALVQASGTLIREDTETNGVRFRLLAEEARKPNG